jgi:hypothetical protein
MKLSKIKPCCICHGELLHPPAGNWYVLRVSIAMLNAGAFNEVMGLCQMYGGLNALPIAEAMAPRPEDVVMVLADKDPRLMTELHVCMNCFVRKLGLLPTAIEHANETKE